MYPFRRFRFRNGACCGNCGRSQYHHGQRFEKSPRVETTGNLKIPATERCRLIVPFPAHHEKFILAEADSFEEPTDFSGWSVSPVSPTYEVTFAVEDGKFVANATYSRGTVIMFQ
jgi:hypothetical protein